MGRSADAKIFYGCVIEGIDEGHIHWLVDDDDEKTHQYLESSEPDDVLRLYVSRRDGLSLEYEDVEQVDVALIDALPFEMSPQGYSDMNLYHVQLKKPEQWVTGYGFEPLDLDMIQKGPSKEDVAALENFMRVMNLQDKAKIGWFVCANYS